MIILREVLVSSRFHLVTLAASLLLVSCAHDGEGGLENYLIEKNEAITRQLDDWAEKLDLYFAKDRYVDVPNQSRLTIYNAFTLREGGKRVYSPHVGAKLHLPNLQQKLQLNFTNYKSDATGRGVAENRYRTVPDDNAYTTSLSLFEDLGDVHTEFRPLLEFTDRLQTSYLFRFTSDAVRGDFTLEPEAQIFARSDTGTGEFVALNGGYKLGKDDGLKLINEEQYTDGDNTLSTNHGFKWVHHFDDVIYQETAFVMESNNRSIYHLDRSVLSSTFHHLWRKNVVHYSITPYWIFDKTAKFYPLTALDFQVEIIF